jgi:hypothetical protein
MFFTLEITAGVLRAYDDGAAENAPFLFACSLSGDEGAAMLKGLQAEKFAVMLKPRNRHALRKLLRSSGFRSVAWRRHTFGRPDRLLVHPL